MDNYSKKKKKEKRKKDNDMSCPKPLSAKD